MVDAEATEVMTLPQAADYLKLHPVTLRGMMKTRKHPPGRKLGGRWRFHKAALDAYLSGEPWQEAPTPSSHAARKTPGTSATPTQADSAYFEALGLPTGRSQPSGRQSSTRKHTARAA
ncbi:helix-turn-helix domain-containing protein [Xanthomonas arboricola]|uniref:helix-turn-helix domain-containing protein n=2 Tax=Xanthomonas arboricola TaxID=56448 RepID=UPI0009B8FD1F|nr:DNA-binding protein [Xanthomonas arboricola]PPT51971.1 DNA-binding protein [Xanthomonas arboricola]